MTTSKKTDLVHSTTTIRKGLKTNVSKTDTLAARKEKAAKEATEIRSNVNKRAPAKRVAKPAAAKPAVAKKAAVAKAPVADTPVQHATEALAPLADLQKYLQEEYLIDTVIGAANAVSVEGFLKANVGIAGLARYLAHTGVPMAMATEAVNNTLRENAGEVNARKVVMSLIARLDGLREWGKEYDAAARELGRYGLKAAIEGNALDVRSAAGIDFQLPGLSPTYSQPFEAPVMKALEDWETAQRGDVVADGDTPYLKIWAVQLQNLLAYLGRDVTLPFSQPHETQEKLFENVGLVQRTLIRETHADPSTVWTLPSPFEYKNANYRWRDVALAFLRAKEATVAKGLKQGTPAHTAALYNELSCVRDRLAVAKMARIPLEQYEESQRSELRRMLRDFGLHVNVHCGVDIPPEGVYNRDGNYLKYDYVDVERSFSMAMSSPHCGNHDEVVLYYMQTYTPTIAKKKEKEEKKAKEDAQATAKVLQADGAGIIDHVQPDAADKTNELYERLRGYGFKVDVFGSRVIARQIGSADYEKLCFTLPYEVVARTYSQLSNLPEIQEAEKLAGGSGNIFISRLVDALDTLLAHHNELKSIKRQISEPLPEVVHSLMDQVRARRCELNELLGGGNGEPVTMYTIMLKRHVESMEEVIKTFMAAQRRAAGAIRQEANPETPATSKDPVKDVDAVKQTTEPGQSLLEMNKEYIGNLITGISGALKDLFKAPAPDQCKTLESFTKAVTDRFTREHIDALAEELRKQPERLKELLDDFKVKNSTVAQCLKNMLDGTAAVTEPVVTDKGQKTLAAGEFPLSDFACERMVDYLCNTCVMQRDESTRTPRVSLFDWLLETGHSLEFSVSEDKTGQIRNNIDVRSLGWRKTVEAYQKRDEAIAANREAVATGQTSDVIASSQKLAEATKELHERTEGTAATGGTHADTANSFKTIESMAATLALAKISEVLHEDSKIDGNARNAASSEELAPGAVSKEAVSTDEEFFTNAYLLRYFLRNLPEQHLIDPENPPADIKKVLSELRRQLLCDLGDSVATTKISEIREGRWIGHDETPVTGINPDNGLIPAAVQKPKAE